VNDRSNLSNLDRVSPCLALLWLQIQNFFDVLSRENMMTSANSFREVKTLKQSTEVAKSNVSV